MKGQAMTKQKLQKGGAKGKGRGSKGKASDELTAERIRAILEDPDGCPN